MDTNRKYLAPDGKQFLKLKGIPSLKCEYIQLTTRWYGKKWKPTQALRYHIRCIGKSPFPTADTKRPKWDSNWRKDRKSSSRFEFDAFNLVISAAVFIFICRRSSMERRTSLDRGYSRLRTDFDVINYIRSANRKCHWIGYHFFCKWNFVGKSYLGLVWFVRSTRANNQNSELSDDHDWLAIGQIGQGHLIRIVCLFFIHSNTLCIIDSEHRVFFIHLLGLFTNKWIANFVEIFKYWPGQRNMNMLILYRRVDATTDNNIQHIINRGHWIATLLYSAHWFFPSVLTRKV